MTLVQQLHELFVARGWTLSVAESCTGGAIASTLVSQPGASDYFLGSSVTYANSAKIRVLGVRESLVQAHSAVSFPVAVEMAQQARRKFGSTWALSTTGYAGPDGGSEDFPTGSLVASVVGPGFVWKGRRVCEAKSRTDFIDEAARWAMTALLERAQ